MNVKFGNVKTLKQKYGEYEYHPQTYQMIKAEPVYQYSDVKITFPTEPHLLMMKEKIIEKVETITTTIDYKKINLLNFIDMDKLIEARPGKVKAYYLDDLKNISKLLNVFKNDRPKSYFIEQITEQMNTMFGNNPNLIKDLKNLDTKDINVIASLFDKHYISEPTKTDVLSRIKITINKYFNNTDLTNQIIKTIESEWMIIK